MNYRLVFIPYHLLFDLRLTTTFFSLELSLGPTSKKGLLDGSQDNQEIQKQGCFLDVKEIILQSFCGILFCSRIIMSGLGPASYSRFDRMSQEVIRYLLCKLILKNFSDRPGAHKTYTRPPRPSASLRLAGGRA